MIPYKLPLSVKRAWTGYKLVDADGRTVAAAPAFRWPAAHPHEEERFIHESFNALADAANSYAD